MRMAAERAEHEQVRARARARTPLLPPMLRGFGGRLAHRVLHGVDVLFGHRALRTLASGSATMRTRALAGAIATAPPSLRALTAAMRIARKRNRSPQNGAGRGDGSSQRSLL